MIFLFNFLKLIPYDIYVYQKSRLYSSRPNFHRNVITLWNYAALRICIRFLGCRSLKISACLLAATCI